MLSNSSSNYHYGGGSKHTKHRQSMAEINVTPMVDVMLVLLVIFMVTAPLLVTGVQVDLPSVAANELRSEEQPLTVTVDANGYVFVHDVLVKTEELVSKLITDTDKKLNTRIFIRGDKGIQYGRMMEVMGTITAAGFSKVALVAAALPRKYEMAREKVTTAAHSEKKGP